jgi:ferrous iron transport protein A
LPSTIPLSQSRRGHQGVVVGVAATAHDGAAAHDLERRLLELGFVEGARIEVLHEGLIRRDPICVRVDDTRVALRRREAHSITVQLSAIPA